MRQHGGEVAITDDVDSTRRGSTIVDTRTISAFPRRSQRSGDPDRIV
jgi:hypothetical protein